MTGIFQILLAGAGGPSSVTVDYLVVAGGGSGAIRTGAGGGAGGYRTSAGTSGGGASAESALTLSVGTAYTITVGATGSGSGSADVAGAPGGNSVFELQTRS